MLNFLCNFCHLFTLFGEKVCIFVNIVNYLHIRKALLKENSPSCGINFVYDGTFSNKLVAKSGITAQALKELGLELFNETQIQELINVKKKNN